MNKLTKDQVLRIPVLLSEDRSIQWIAEEYDVTVPAIWYWIRKLRDAGVVIKSNKPGRQPLLKV